MKHEGLAYEPPYERCNSGVIACPRRRQDYRPSPWCLRRWFRVEGRSRHSSVSRLYSSSRPGALDDLRSRRGCGAASTGQGKSLCVGWTQLWRHGHNRGRTASFGQVTCIRLSFLPDVGESAGALQKKTPPAGNSIEPVGDGFLQINLAAFPNDFAADVPKSVARFMA